MGSLAEPAERRGHGRTACQPLSGNAVFKARVLFLDPIVKDQARMGSSNMPGGSTPVSSASMMSGQFCSPLSLARSVLKH